MHVELDRVNMKISAQIFNVLRSEFLRFRFDLSVVGYLTIGADVSSELVFEVVCNQIPLAQVVFRCQNRKSKLCCL